MGAADFWTSQAAFWASHPGAAAKGKALGVRPEVGSLPGWKSAVRVPSSASSPGDLIIEDGSAGEWAQRMVDAVGPAVETAMAHQLGDVMQAGAEAWPVKSGLSRGVLSLTFSGVGSTFVSRMGGRAPYTSMIKGDPWRTLIERPARAAVAAAGTEAMAAVAQQGG